MNCLASQTRYLDIGPLVANFHVDSVEESLIIIAMELTKAIRMIDGMEHVEIAYRNILERDDNPDGSKMFFRVTNIDPKNSRSDIRFKQVVDYPKVLRLFA